MTWIIFTVAFILFIVAAYNDWGFTALIFFGLTLGTCVVGCENTEWSKERNKLMAEQDQRERTPHVIREADGCKVYAFRTDRDHYFTRCGPTVTTETNWSRTCGKNCIKQESDTIVTDGNK